MVCVKDLDSEFGVLLERFLATPNFVLPVFLVMARWFPHQSYQFGDVGVLRDVVNGYVKVQRCALLTAKEFDVCLWFVALATVCVEASKLELPDFADYISNGCLLSCENNYFRP